ncbi:MAG: HPr family phosphocarrier protein [Chloroflexi bacterium]|nr:HPr family phosphocarrier protein [Chloroflexota bacterium]
MTQTELTIEHEVGLHARPAALFVETAARFSSTITVENLSTASGAVNAKSILSLLTSGVGHGHRIRITADGADESDALQALHQLVEGNFGEIRKL